MKSKFKVGDLVRVWKPKDVISGTLNWIEPFGETDDCHMDMYDGKVFEISDIDDDEISLHYIGWFFDPSWLTKVDCHLDIIWKENK